MPEASKAQEKKEIKSEKATEKLFNDVIREAEVEIGLIDSSNFSQVMANSVKEIMDVYALVKNKADKVEDKNEKESLMLLADSVKCSADRHLERMKVDYEKGKKTGTDEDEILRNIRTECLEAKIKGKILKTEYKIFGERCLRYDVTKNSVYI